MYYIPHRKGDNILKQLIFKACHVGMLFAYIVGRIAKIRGEKQIEFFK